MLMTWEEIVLGAQSGAFELTVTHEMIDEYIDSMELDYPAFAKARGDQRIAPPDMVPKLAMRPLFIEYLKANIGKGVRAKQGFTFHRPVPVGTHLTAVGHLVNKYEKRDKRFVSFEATFHDAAGTPFVTDRRTIMVVQPGFSIKQ